MISTANPWKDLRRVGPPPAVDIPAVWRAYRGGVNDLARVGVRARAERERSERSRTEAVARAKEALATASAERAALESELPLFEKRVRRVLEITGTTPHGVGSGTVSVDANDVTGVRAAMGDITRDLNAAVTDLAAARAAERARRRWWAAIGIVVLAVLLTVGVLWLLRAPSFVMVAGGVVVFAFAMLGRRGGPVLAAVVGASVLAGVVLVVWLTGVVVTMVVMSVVAMVGVVVLIRPRRRPTARPVFVGSGPRKPADGTVLRDRSS